MNGLILVVLSYSPLHKLQAEIQELLWDARMKLGAEK